MTLTTAKLRSIVNLLSDPGSAANAAGILAKEAKERGLLVAGLVAQTMAAPAPIPSPAPSPPPSWQVEPYVKRIGPDHIGLVSEILAETRPGAVNCRAATRCGWRRALSTITARTHKGVRYLFCLVGLPGKAGCYEQCRSCAAQGPPPTSSRVSLGANGSGVGGA
jgi:hypothetical protein